jgi:hypothetical protein
MCRVPFITRFCCGMLYDRGDLELPILRPCSKADIDPSKEGSEWTGCAVREFIEAT